MAKTKKKKPKPLGNGQRLNGRGCRAKGHEFERWVAKMLRKAFPDAIRHLEYQQREANGCDVVNTGQYKIQCKRGRRYAPLSKIKEVQLCPIEGGVPVLITKGDHEEPLACISFSHFLKLVKYERLHLSTKK